MPNGLHPLRTRTATVVVNGDDVFEDLFTAASELQSLLAAEGFAARIALGTARFEAAADVADVADRSTGGAGTDGDGEIAGNDLIVLYTAAGRFGTRARAGLARAVHGGAGLIAVHSANVPDKAGESALAEDPLLSLIGSRYIAHGPPPHESRFRVLLDDSHELTAGIAPFDVTHEHYRLETAPGTRVLAWREGPAPGGNEPLIHVRTHGDGRVCYIQLGHDLRIWGNPRCANSSGGRPAGRAVAPPGECDNANPRQKNGLLLGDRVGRHQP